MRHLASIQRILAIAPIDGADAIERATVLGWQLVVKKGEFNVGDLCVYLEIDSVLPDRPEFEFLRAKSFRIKTARLRGQISQGICFPLSILPPDILAEEGADVTEALGIIKYEAPVPLGLAGLMKGSFPSFIPKTDETRVQVLQELLDAHKGRLCYITEKIDGTSVTFFVKDGVFGVCSRNMELLDSPGSIYWEAARAAGLDDKMLSLGRNIALQGELAGPGIQGNKLKLDRQQVFFFSCFDIDGYRYADYDELQSLCNALGIQMAPVISADYYLSNSIEDLLALATRRSVLRKEAWAEGIVIRERYSDEHISFKAINNEFLLKYGE